ncbi:hypothetical protein BJ165DRAFT_1596364, partial [Panaeolus papilionaceus]
MWMSRAFEGGEEGVMRVPQLSEKMCSLHLHGSRCGEVGKEDGIATVLVSYNARYPLHSLTSKLNLRLSVTSILTFVHLPFIFMVISTNSGQSRISRGEDQGSAYERGCRGSGEVKGEEGRREKKGHGKRRKEARHDERLYRRGIENNQRFHKVQLQGFDHGHGRSIDTTVAYDDESIPFIVELCKERNNPNTLSDPALEESDSNSDSGSGLELGSDEFEETTSEGGKVEVRAQDDMEGILAKVWDLTIEEEEAQFKDALREVSEVRRKRRKVGSNPKKPTERPPPRPILSHQVKSLIGDSNQAYVENNSHEAIRIMHEVMGALHSLHGVLLRAVAVICAFARIKTGDVDEVEGKYDASIILTLDVLDSSVLFLGIADGCFEKEMTTTRNHPFPQKAQNQLGPTGTPAPAPSTGEDPTVTSHFAENKFLNASKAKSGGAGSETEADVGVVEGAGGGEGEGSCEGGGGA